MLVTNRTQSKGISLRNKLFVQTYTRMFSSLVYYAVSKNVPYPKAEDLVQQIFLKIYDNKEFKLDKIVKVDAYLYRSVNNRINNHYRDNKLQLYEYEKLLIYEKDPSPNPLEILERKDRVTKFNRIIQSLPVKRRQVFKLYYYQRYSQKEIAERLGISRKTVENQVGATYKVLRAAFNE